MPITPQQQDRDPAPRRDGPLQLAVVGHTNAGKTSLLRTLTRDTGFGEVSDRPATTRDVRGSELLADGVALLALYDTPGLEDALGLRELIEREGAGAPDPVAAIDRFLAGSHGEGRFEQEAKVLRRLLACDAALVVVDAREPVLAKHREEFALLAGCGRPLLPLLNFVADAEADVDAWRAQLARVGLHVVAEFDTVVFDDAAEAALFDKLGVLIERARPQLQRLAGARRSEREAQRDAALATLAECLEQVAMEHVTLAADAPLEEGAAALRARVAAAEGRCVDALLGLYRFDLQSYAPPPLPLADGRWDEDPFDPEVLRRHGLEAGSAAAAGGAAGLAIDAMTGGLSLGAGAALGAGAGLLWHTGGRYGRRVMERLRGLRRLQVDDATLALLCRRELQLLAALRRRGHAATRPVQAADAPQGWPSDELRRLLRRAKSGRPPPRAALQDALRRALPR